MDTYAGDMDVFTAALDRAMTLIGSPKIGIGLEFRTINIRSKGREVEVTIREAEVKQRSRREAEK